MAGENKTFYRCAMEETPILNIKTLFNYLFLFQSITGWRGGGEHDLAKFRIPMIHPGSIGVVPAPLVNKEEIHESR